MNIKQIIYFIYFSLAIALAPAVIYLFNFNEKKLPLDNFLANIPKDSQAWSNFGSFLSGTTGALFSFIGTLAVIWTLFKTHEASEKQIKMLSNDQTFNQFNKLLDSLVEILNTKTYPRTIFGGENKSDDFKENIYFGITVSVCQILASVSPENKVKHIDTRLVSGVCSKFISDYSPNIFKKESAVYTAIIDRIRSADRTTNEAMIAILSAKLDEHLIFFLNCDQIEKTSFGKFISIPGIDMLLSVPSELMEDIEGTLNVPFSPPQEANPQH